MNVYEEKIVKDYEPIKEIGSRLGFERGRIGRFKINPSELAAYNLYKILEKFPEYTKEGRSQVQNFYKSFEGLENLNLKLFASVLSFLRKYSKPTPENFKDEIILEYISPLLPSKESDRKRLIVRFKADFLRYIIAIINYQNEKEEILQPVEEQIEEIEEYEEYEEEDEYEYSE